MRKDYDIELSKIYIGTYMTSLDCQGFFVTLLSYVPTGTEHSLIQLLDESSQSIGWTPNLLSEAWKKKSGADDGEHPGHDKNLPQTSVPESHLLLDEGFLQRLQSGLQAVTHAEPEITRYDSVIGDGDYGTILKRGAEGDLSTRGESTLLP